MYPLHILRPTWPPPLLVSSSLHCNDPHNKGARLFLRYLDLQRNSFIKNLKWVIIKARLVLRGFSSTPPEARIKDCRINYFHLAWKIENKQIKNRTCWLTDRPPVLLVVATGSALMKIYSLSSGQTIDYSLSLSIICKHRTKWKGAKNRQWDGWWSPCVLHAAGHMRVKKKEMGSAKLLILWKYFG